MTDLLGNKYGAWTVVGDSYSPGKVLCACACGRIEKPVRTADLLNGRTTMCRKCSTSLAKTEASTHSHASEYSSWMHMTQRCMNPNDKDYPKYGGRGITVFPPWLESFDAFLLMLGPKPDSSYTIERIDVNGNYEPGNVKWATRDEQNRNTRSNVHLTAFGESKTISEWSRDPRARVSDKTMYKRFLLGWDPETIITKASRKGNK